MLSKEIPALVKQRSIHLNKLDQLAAKQLFAHLHILGVLATTAEECNQFIKDEGCREKSKRCAGPDLLPVLAGSAVILVVRDFESREVA